jgi:transposase InsO family protein
MAGRRLSPYRSRASPTRKLPALTNFARPTAIARPQYNAIVLHVRHEQPAQKAHDPQCHSPTRRPFRESALVDKVMRNYKDCWVGRDRLRIVMSSIMRWRRGLIWAIGGSPVLSSMGVGNHIFSDRRLLFSHLQVASRWRNSPAASPPFQQAGRQLPHRGFVQCCAWDRAPPRFLIHDRDSRYGANFDRRVRGLGIRQVRTPFRSPPANAVAERWVRSVRSECLDHLIVFNEANFASSSIRVRHLLQSLATASLVGPGSSCGEARPLPWQACRKIVAEPVLGGLHHIYRAAA